MQKYGNMLCMLIHYFHNKLYIQYSFKSFCLYRSLYVDEFLFNEVGIEMSIAIDIALALGNTESIVESLYSVMKSQCMEGGQDNSTLALRYKLSCYSFLFLDLKLFISIKIQLLAIYIRLQRWPESNGPKAQIFSIKSI